MSKLDKVKLKYEDTKPKLKTKQLAKPKETKMETKSPEKTIKVKTLFISVGVVIGLIVSFIAGITTANAYNDKITNDAKALAEVMSKTDAK